MRENFLEDSVTGLAFHDDSDIAELNELMDDSWCTSRGHWTVLRRTESKQLSLDENISLCTEEQSEKVLHGKYGWKRGPIVVPGQSHSFRPENKIITAFWRNLKFSPREKKGGSTASQKQALQSPVLAAVCSFILFGLWILLTFKTEDDREGGGDFEWKHYVCIHYNVKTVNIIIVWNLQNLVTLYIVISTTTAANWMFSVKQTTPLHHVIQICIIILGDILPSNTVSG